ncbi:MAG TPA: hypothetical protein VNZ04_02130 [Trinickia sp.]|jgi:hypothetical protein|nr:hypothetical protein [Trinickia sp.]
MASAAFDERSGERDEQHDEGRTESVADRAALRILIRPSFVRARTAAIEPAIRARLLESAGQ